MSFDATAAAISARTLAPFRKRLNSTALTALLLAATATGASADGRYFMAPLVPGGPMQMTDDLEKAAASWVTTEFTDTGVLSKLLAQYAYAFGARGQGARIGVMDGGLWTGHDEFTGQKIENIHSEGKFEITLHNAGGKPFAKAGDSFSVDGLWYGPTDLVPLMDRHPQFTAGTILARRNGTGSHGIAFDSTIYVAQSGELIYKDEQGSLDNNVIEAKEKDPELFRQSMQELVKAGAQVILLEMQLLPKPRNADTQGWFVDLMRQYAGGKGGTLLTAMEDAAKAGVVHVVAAGNYNPDTPWIAAALPVFRPELEKSWIAVVEDETKSNPCGPARFFCIAGYSNIYAPTTEADEYDIYTGTSGASAVTAASMGVLLSRYPYLQATAVRDILLTTAKDIGDPGVDAKTGWGLIDLKKSMSGPAQFLGRFEANLPAGLSDTWSNAISQDVLSQRRQEDSKEISDWDKKKEERGWQNGVTEAQTKINLVKDFSGGRLVAAEDLIKAAFKLLPTRSIDAARALALAIDKIKADPIASGIFTAFTAKYKTWTTSKTELADYISFRASAEGANNVIIDAILSDRVVADTMENEITQTRINALASKTYDAGLTKSGLGTLRLTGQNTYTGDTIINGGLLAVDGSIASKAIINDSGILGGVGSVGSLLANSGGVVSPGNSVGRLTVTGDATFEKGSVFDVEIAADAGAADQLDVTGKVALLGGAVQARIEGETAFFTKDQVVGLFTRSYDILLAGKGIEGRFDTVLPQYNYISAMLDYSNKNKVTLGFMLPPDPVLVVDPEIGAPIVPTVEEFVFEPELELVAEDAEKARLSRIEAERLKLEALRERIRTLVLVDTKTKNQKSAGDAIKQMDIGNPLLNTVLFSQVGQALPYDNLTGEVHATLDGVLIEDSHFISTAATDRIRAAFDGVAAKAQPVIAPLAYGAPVKAKGSEAFGTFDLAGGSTGSVPAPAATALWGEAYGAFARGISDGNASRYSRSTGGFVTGLDGVVADTWRFGLLAGYGSSSLNGNGKALVDSYQIGLYGGTTWDSLGLRFGANLGHHEIETKRIAIFGGLANEHEASYGAKTVQVFGEIGYEIKTAYAELEPFAGVSHVHLKTDAFEETGDISNLSGEASTTDLTTTTLGLRVSRDFALSESVNVTARGTLGWRHAYGDVTPQQRLAFAGDQAFSVEGLPVAQDTGFVEAGLDLGIGRNTTLGISYSGQFSKSASDNAVKADLTVRF